MFNWVGWVTEVKLAQLIIPQGAKFGTIQPRYPKVHSKQVPDYPSIHQCITKHSSTKLHSSNKLHVELFSKLVRHSPYPQDHNVFQPTSTVAHYFHWHLLCNRPQEFLFYILHWLITPNCNLIPSNQWLHSSDNCALLSQYPMIITQEFAQNNHYASFASF